MKVATIKRGKPYLYADVKSWGGKGDNLLRLAQVCNVAQGFVLSADTYTEWLRDSDLNGFLCDALRYNDAEKAHQTIREKFLSAEFSQDLISRLQSDLSKLEKPVVARSSSVNEDGNKNSYAGQHDSVLGITDFDKFLNAIKEVYASLHTPRAIEYRKSQNLNGDDSIAVVVQSMINPSASGVVYSTSPNNSDEILVESNYGLCTSVVEGRACDIYRVRDIQLETIIKDINPNKRKVDIFDKRKNKVVTENVPFWKARRYSLDDSQVLSVARIAKTLEKAYGTPMDMEFAFEEGTGQLYILQARPLTGINMHGEDITLPDLPNNQILARSRNIRKQGIFEGPAVVVRGVDHVNKRFNVDGDLAEMNRQYNSGYVLLAPEIPPQLEQHVTNAKAMIVTECGTTGHAAAIACEKGIIYMGRAVSSNGSLLESIRSGTRIGVAASKEEGVLYRLN